MRLRDGATLTSTFLVDTLPLGHTGHPTFLPSCPFYMADSDQKILPTVKHRRRDASSALWADTALSGWPKVRRPQGMQLFLDFLYFLLVPVNCLFVTNYDSLQDCYSFL
ncbi:hypothetical protein ABFS83_01G061300 [Erythranthe nasuta]